MYDRRTKPRLLVPLAKGNIGEEYDVLGDLRLSMGQYCGSGHQILCNES